MPQSALQPPTHNTDYQADIVRRDKAFDVEDQRRAAGRNSTPRIAAVEESREKTEATEPVSPIYLNSVIADTLDSDSSSESSGYETDPTSTSENESLPPKKPGTARRTFK